MGRDDAPARFRSAYDAGGLPDAVSAVARHVRPHAPQTVSQREFDRARAQVPEHSGAPTARQICARLRVGWAQLLADLFTPGGVTEQRLSVRQGVGASHWLGEDHVRAALRMIALRAGVPTLRPHAYAAARSELLATARRRRHTEVPLLPTVSQIERVAGDWARALALAGLTPSPPATGSQPSSVSYLEAITRFLISQGAMPRSRDLEAFARAQGFPLPRTPAGGHPNAVLEAHDAFAAQGRWAPRTPPPPGQRPEYDFDRALTRAPGERRRQRRWSEEQCIDALIAYLDQLDPTDHARQKRYGAWATGKPYPSSSSFARYGGWTVLLAEARARRRPQAHP